jgi:hypothetical protein
VALSRARDRTEIYVSREDLGEDGTDADLIGRLAQRVSTSNVQEASVTRERVARDPAEAQRDEQPVAAESRIGRVLREQQEREGARGRGRGYGIE